MVSLRPFRIIVKLFFGNHHKAIQILTSKFGLMKTCDYTSNVEDSLCPNLKPHNPEHLPRKKTMFGNWVPCLAPHASGFQNSLTLTCQQLKTCNSFFKLENITCSLKTCYPKKSFSSKLATCSIGAFTRLRW
jgi:hypothetical protein